MKQSKRQSRKERWVSDLEADFRRDILQSESDRGAVLVASAFIEESLEHLLSARFRSHCPNITDGELNELLTQPHAPLSGFSARTRLAFAIGLLDEKTRDALDRIRELRNAFAHRTKVNSPKLNHDFVKELLDLLLEQGKAYNLNQIGVFPPRLDGPLKGYRVNFAFVVWLLIVRIRRVEESLSGKG